MYRFARASIAAVALATVSAGPMTAQVQAPDNSFYDTASNPISDLGYLLFANEYIKAINCQYDTEIPLAGIAEVFANNGCFFASVDVGGTIPVNKPELKGFGQNLDLRSGAAISGGPGLIIPFPAGPNTGRFALIVGADAFFSELGAKQITNQANTGVLPVSGHYRSIGVLPYAGLGYLTRWNWFISFDAAAGVARNSVELFQNGPLVDGSDIGLVWRLRSRLLLPLTHNLMVGLSADYSGTGDVNARVVTSGATFVMGGTRIFRVGGHFTLTHNVVDRRVQTQLNR